MEELFRVVLPPPPLTCVPTTAGTGSEASIAAVLTNSERQRKLASADLKLLPAITVIDPELMRRRDCEALLTQLTRCSYNE